MIPLFSRGRRKPIDDELWKWALSEHPILHGLTADDADVLRSLSEELLSKKQFVPLGGVELGVETTISIAVQAGLPILHLGARWYRDWGTLYLVPEEYEFEDTEVDEAGVVHEISDIASGQTMLLGSVVLSVVDVEASGWCDGYNVVIHEMAHILDRQNGRIDGAPPLHREMKQAIWAGVFTAAFDDFQAKVTGSSRRSRSASLGQKGRVRSRIDPYAAEAPEEFFAVACELFFEQPWVIRREYPAVYEQLSQFYRQDPFSRLSAPPRRS